MKLDRSLRTRLTSAGQEFLADHIEALEPARQEALVRQVETLDLEAIARLRSGEGLAAPPGEDWEPMDFVPAPWRGRSTTAAVRGEMELRAGKVAFVLVAGGQASRLRWDGPKGMFPIGPVTDRSLFRLLVEHIVRAGRDYGATPHVTVTTSPTTDAAIRAYFETNECFGLDRAVLSFVCQPSLPAFDDEGRLILAAPDRIFTSPAGHGGALQAVETQGVLSAWEQQGVTTVCTMQVDNPLLRVVDPDFVGRIWSEGAPIATKVVLKERPDEKLGIVIRLGGRPAIVEYTEMPPALAARRDRDGGLTYRLGSIAAHAFRLDFLRRALASPLPLHLARKEIPCVDAEGRALRRTGTKYEQFIFDLFPRASDLAVVEVLREREYAPVKNAEGPESPETARRALDAEYRRWYRAAGRPVPDLPALELSPLEAIGPDDLRAAK